MDLASFVIALLPTLAVGCVCVLAFVRRRRMSPLILNPYTLALEPDADALGHLPIVQPSPPTTTSQSW